MKDIALNCLAYHQEFFFVNTNDKFENFKSLLKTLLVP